MVEFIPEEELTVNGRIGRGPISTVDEVVWLRNGRILALKTFEGNCAIAKRVEFTQTMRKLSELNHENLVSLLGYNSGAPFILMDLMKGGSLHDYIHSSRYVIEDRLAYPRMMKLMGGVINGMIYLHDKNIIHRQLNSSNVLLDQTYQNAKISDYGLEKMNEFLIGLPQQSSNGQNNSARYMAPEVAKGGHAVSGSDAWSFGCILLEIATKQVPFSFLTNNQMLSVLRDDEVEFNRERLYSFKRNPNMMRQMIRCIQKCLKKAAVERRTFRELKDYIDNYQDPWMRAVGQIEWLRVHNEELERDLLSLRDRNVHLERTIRQLRNQLVAQPIQRIETIEEEDVSLVDNITAPATAPASPPSISEATTSTTLNTTTTTSQNRVRPWPSVRNSNPDDTRQQILHRSYFSLRPQAPKR